MLCDENCQQCQCYCAGNCDLIRVFLCYANCLNIEPVTNQAHNKRLLARKCRPILKVGIPIYWTKANYFVYHNMLIRQVRHPVINATSRRNDSKRESTTASHRQPLTLSGTIPPNKKLCITYMHATHYLR